MATANYITCITRMLLNSHSRALRATSCPGSEMLMDTHCCHCGYLEREMGEDEDATDE